MERREFLKYLISASALTCSGCVFKNENAFSSTKLVKDKTLQTIKIPICYHCNLNCASCCHFSPLAKEFDVPIEDFEKDLAQLQKVTKGRLKILKLLGGEPLLHKNINEILKISHDYFPKSDKRIISNGLLLEKMPETFWESCRDFKIYIDVRNYVKYQQNNIDVKKCYKIANKYGVRLKIANSKENFVSSNLSKKEKLIPKRREYKCPQLDRGLISPCAIISNIRFFNDYFKEYAIPVSENNYLDLYKISSVDEIEKFLSTPKNMCKYCGYGDISSPWHLSKNELSEWYDVNEV